ncbi:MAG: hypothetical protein HY242_09715 [Afipia sp.]|nr:hypothetical protein [Afipia sp.]
MANRNRADIEIDHVHAQAICQGIGERLRDALEKNWERAPAKMHDLYARLPELDSEDSPSIVPPSRGGF